jgi:UDP-glucose 4-epimerase
MKWGQERTMSTLLKNKILLITGGTGSFGQAMLAQALQSGPQEVRIFSRDEKKQDAMRVALGDDRVKFVIGDVRDYDSIHDALDGVDFVFHAAALKQVPSCEFFPMEAVRTNVLGGENVLRACVARQVQRVVVLSSDKAVYPINAMGMSKALMEKITIARALGCDARKTLVCSTRYGNAMGSRGSVIPLFLDQLQAGKPLTLTDPAMTRFMMTLDDSIRLVLHAFENAQAGDIFILKSPACTLAVLAQALQELFGRELAVRTMGARHGEKLHESLIAREEMPRAVDLGSYYRIAADLRGLNYEQYGQPPPAGPQALADYTSKNTQHLTVEAVKTRLLQLDGVRKALPPGAPR